MSEALTSAALGVAAPELIPVQMGVQVASKVGKKALQEWVLIAMVIIGIIGLISIFMSGISGSIGGAEAPVMASNVFMNISFMFAGLLLILGLGYFQEGLLFGGISIIIISLLLSGSGSGSSGSSLVF